MANWDKRFMELAKHVSTWSKDTNTKLGAVIVDDEHTILSIGYNGLCRGAEDNIQERYERPQKYLYTEHAERNAIYNAVRSGVSLKGSTIYVPMFPCVDCARGIINSGIKKIVSYEPNFNDERWGESFKVSYEMLKECGVKIDTYSDENDWFYNHFKSVYDEKREIDGKIYEPIEWNYPMLKTGYLTQKDWNQTLLTKINQSSAIIIKGNLKSGANRIRCGKKAFQVIADFEFFKSDAMLLGSKYEVIIDNNIPEDEIIVYYDGRRGSGGKEEKFNYVSIKVFNL